MRKTKKRLLWSKWYRYYHLDAWLIYTGPESKWKTIIFNCISNKEIKF